MVLMHEMFKELLHGVRSRMNKNIRLEFRVFRDGIHGDATDLMIIDNFSLGRIGFGPCMRHENCFKIAKKLQNRVVLSFPYYAIEEWLLCCLPRDISWR